MATHQLAQAITPEPEQASRALDGAHGAPQAVRFWLTPAQVFTQMEVGKNVKATRQWLRDHGLVARGDGKFSRRDVQRALDRKRRHRMHPASLANLRKRAR